MTPDERTLLTGFFDRLGQAPASEKDREADDLIRRAVDRDPDLAYRMTQTALVYEQGLAAAQEQIRRLQADLQARPPVPAAATGSFLGSVPRVPMTGAAQGMQGAPGGAMFAGRGFNGGGQGFLGSAMSTALGVAGGMALFSGLESMFAGGSGMAAQAAVPQDTIADQAAAPAGPWGAPTDAAAAEPAGHDGGGHDGGGYDPGSSTYDQGVYDPSTEDPGGFGDGGDFDFDF